MTINRFSLLLIIPCLFTQCVEDRLVGPVNPNASVVLHINEMLSTGDPDWMEIYNPNPDTVRVGGFRVYDTGTIDDKYTLPDLAIPPGGYLVLFCDDMGTGAHTNFRLSSNGEQVGLEDSQGNTIATVDFPAIPSGQSYGQNPEGSGNFTFFDTPTQGMSNTGPAVNSPPAITDVSHTPQAPTPIDTVTVRATVMDDAGLQAVTLVYITGAGAPLAGNMQSIGANRFEATILPVADGTSVRYYIQATDNRNQISILPSEAPAATFSYTASVSAYVPPRLFINEFLTGNDTVNKDPDFDSFEDWIEIYNGEGTDVNMGGMYLTDDLTDPRQWRIPDGVVIPSGGYLLFWADDEDQSLTAHHTNFKLSKGGEEIGLFAPDLFNNVPIDTLSYGSQADDISFGRNPDGSDTFQTFTTPTPEGPN